MTQYTFPTLNPATETGNQLATDLNGLWPAIISSHRGNARPAYAVAGTPWIKIVSGTVEQFYIYTGTTDSLIGTFNPSTGAWTPAGVTSQIPVGLGPVAWPGTVAPSLWILSYGQAISRTTYAGLFAVLGTTYGAGDGSTTFNMPDWRGRIAAFKDDMGGSAAGRLTNAVMSPNGNTIGAVGGSQTVTLSIAEMPAHTHTVAQGATKNGSGADQTLRPFIGGTPIASESTGGGAAHKNVQPTMIHNGIYYAGV